MPERMTPSDKPRRGTDKGVKKAPITDAQWELFLEHLKNSANMRFSAEAAGFSMQAAYYRKSHSPVYAAQIEEAMIAARDKLLKAAWDRAVDGVERVYYGKGGEPTSTTIYSDKLLIQLLHAYMPERFNRDQKVQVQVDQKVQVILKPEERAVLEPIKRRLLLGGDVNYIDAEVVQAEEQEEPADGDDARASANP